MQGIRSDLPTEGWMYIGEQDLLTAIGKCDLCGTPIRFNHMFQNPDYEGILGIGCECAEKIVNGIDLIQVKSADKKMHSKARKRASDRKKWEERNDYYRSKGLPEITWDEYIAKVEERRRNG